MDLLKEFLVEEKRLELRLGAVRQAIEAYKWDVTRNGNVEVACDEPESGTGRGAISREIRRVIRETSKPLRAKEIHAIVRERLPEVRRSSIETLCGAMCARGELKRISKGMYRAASK